MSWTAWCRALAGVLAALAGLGFLACTPQEKHRVLTFFFDGVPPLHPVETKAEPGKTPDTEPGAAPQVTKVEPPKPPRVIWHEHTPALDPKGCGTCHAVDRSYQLVKPVPELCEVCHKDTRSYPRLHGPVALGTCMSCHQMRQHRSRQKHLLRAPAPNLCFECHERTPAGARTLGCARASDDADCLQCHGPHGGEAAFYLVRRPDSSTEPAKAPAPPASKER